MCSVEHVLSIHAMNHVDARQAIDKLKTLELGTSSAENGQTKVQQCSRCSSVPLDDYLHPYLKVHFGVGCDCCGILLELMEQGGTVKGLIEEEDLVQEGF
uniref:E3 ubiquitin-protein ligase PRT1-like isoform X1 n=1 Tax=Tanacetum cinerariifolium TaxID=118510 RepID=A0A6L2JHI9_TANCI|nr:E3 ubiquitin-protein ligase PRT1-like isoform X1 [Tanacetum cinerariifolium]